MNQRGEQHFNGEKPPAVGAGMDAVYSQLHQATGKTIARIRFGDDPSSDREVHQGEYIVFEFTDGSVLDILTGSNGQNLAEMHTKLKASDIHCSYIALFHEDGNTWRKERLASATS